MRSKLILFTAVMALSFQANAFDFESFKSNAAKLAGEAVTATKAFSNDAIAALNGEERSNVDSGNNQASNQQTYKAGAPKIKQNYRVPHNGHPQNFDQAKKFMYTYVYLDGENHKTSYCGCDINHKSYGKWKGVKPDINSCGLKVRKEGNRYRAERIEAEHIVPASLIGLKNNCMLRNSKNSKKRDLCDRTDKEFSVPYTDLHNLTPITGEVNVDRSNFPFREVPNSNTVGSYGQCDFAVNFKERISMPPQRAKGQVARAYLYMSDRYRIQLSKSDRATYMKWHKENPPSAWDIEKNKRVKQIQGNSNPYIQNLD